MTQFAAVVCASIAGSLQRVALMEEQLVRLHSLVPVEQHEAVDAEVAARRQQCMFRYATGISSADPHTEAIESVIEDVIYGRWPS